MGLYRYFRQHAKAIGVTLTCLVFLTATVLYFSWSRGVSHGHDQAQSLLSEIQLPLRFMETEVDLGLVTEVKKHAFYFQNESGKAVEILAIRSSCSCTATKPSQDIIPPGGTGSIAVTIQPRSGKLGFDTYVVDVEYMAGTLHRARLILRCNHNVDVLSTDDILLRAVLGKATSTEFTLFDFRQVPLGVTKITTSSPDLRVEVVESPSKYLPGWRYIFKATLSPSPRGVGESADTIFVHTDDPEHSIITTKARIQLRKRVRITPEKMYMPHILPAGEVKLGTCFVDDTEGEPVRIAAIVPSHSFLRCVVSGESSPVREITVFVDSASYISGSGPLSVCVSIDHPEIEQKCIPICVSLP